MTNTMQHRDTLTPDTSREYSATIWGDCPLEGIRSGVVDGVFFEDDFIAPYFTVPTTEGVYPPYKAFTSTGGTIKPATQAWGGIITLGSDGDDEGASIQLTNSFMQISRSFGKLWFEARVKVDTIAVTKYDAFIGFGELQTLTATVPITATAGALADKNLVGWLRPGTSTTGDGSIARATYKADGIAAVTVQDNAAAFVADTYIKLGMRFDPSDYYLTFYLNGVPSGRKLIPSAAGTDFPNDILLSPIAAALNTAAVTSVFTIDRWRGFQLGV